MTRVSEHAYTHVMRIFETLIAVCVVLFGAVAGFGLAMSLIHANDSPRALPHRPVTELTNWGQGHVPESNHCPPGTIRFETDDGLFLECMRGTTP